MIDEMNQAIGTNIKASKRDLGPKRTPSGGRT